MNVEDSLVKARIALLLDRCFYGNLALHLPLKENNEIPTFCTDGKHIYYNKEFASKCNDKDKQFILCHEIMHNIFHHLTRKGEREHQRWNIAIDYATNAILNKEFNYVPEGGLYDNKLDGMSAEEIYNALPDMNGKGGEYKRFSNDKFTVEIDAEGNMKINGKDVKSFDEHKDVGKPKEEIDELEKEWKIQLTKAYQQAKIAGKLPAGIDIFIDGLLEPKLDWRTMMKQFVISNAKSDYRWFPPSKRYLHSDMYMPSITDESLGDVVVIIDNSGSVLDCQQKFFSECNGLLQQYEIDLHLIVCDVKVSSYKVYNKDDRIDLKQSGGGGTDLRAAFEYIKTKMINPTVVVCLTDGYTPFPEREEYPTLWVLSKDSVSLEKIPFGMKVRMNE